ncbi:MAG: CopG family transcriptional regulator [Egibacteraceae bacterium]
MKRLQIMIEEDLDAALGRLAAEEGVSKAALIRRCVRRFVEPLPPIDEDPLWGMVGADPDVEPADVDAVVYG